MNEVKMKRYCKTSALWTEDTDCTRFSEYQLKNHCPKNKTGNATDDTDETGDCTQNHMQFCGLFTDGVQLASTRKGQNKDFKISPQKSW